jgi:tetratricopeptide (TPR) repeat protein
MRERPAILRRDGRATNALALFQQASQIDGHFAELEFLWGQSCLVLGQEEEARRHLTRARDEDGLRFRADGPINDLIRKTATGRAAEGIFFADAERALASASSHGLPGNELLFEHVHLNFEGNYLLARTIADQVAKALPETVARRADPRGDWLPAAECARRLAFAGWNRYEGIASILLRLNDPPFTSQWGHAGRYRQLQQQLEALQPALLPPALRQALTECNQARALAPEDWLLDENQGRVLTKLGDLPAAANAWQRVAERVPHDADAFVQKGMLLLQSGQYEQALRQFEAVLRLDPASVQAMDGIGRVLAKQGKIQEAITQFEKVLRLKPNYCETLVNLGLALNATGKSEEAKRRFREALEHKPNTPAALIMLAQICHAEGWLDESVTNFSAALRLNPVDASTQVDLGITLAALGRYPEAGARYAEAVRLEPNSAAAHFRLGFEMGRQDKSAEAIEQFTQAVRIKGDFLEARLNLGVALLKQGRTNEAQVQLDEAGRIDPGNVTVKRLLEKMGK